MIPLLLWLVALVSAASTTQVTAAMSLQVDDRDAATAHLIEAARTSGGWFSALGPTTLILRVPVDQVEPLMLRVAAEGRVVERSIQRQDHSAELTELKTRLQSRTEMLTRYQEVLVSARADAVVMVESQVTSLIAEIEGLTGRIRALEHLAEFGVVSLSFEFRDRKAPAPLGTASFPWMNHLSGAGLLDAFRTDRPLPGKRARGLVLTLPDGFAPFPRTQGHRATNPAGVVYAARAFRTRQPADLPFWSEALRNQLKKAGYTVISEQPLGVDGLSATRFELSAPAGPIDLRWSVVLIVDGKRVLVVEAAGEQAAYARAEAAVQASLQSLRL
jgi:hypothetical protein